MAKLTKELFGVPDGEIYPRTFAAGEECPPELEDAAREIDGLESPEEAEAREKAEAKAAKAAENKASQPTENK